MVDPGFIIVDIGNPTEMSCKEEGRNRQAGRGHRGQEANRGNRQTGTAHRGHEANRGKRRPGTGNGCQENHRNR
jgi:hypothetical protein